MRLLLDTQVFLWLNLAPEKCSTKVLNLCQQVDTDLLLSTVSLWEIQIKHQLGKLPLETTLRQMLEANQLNYGLQLLAIEPRHIYALDTLPDHHRDPFDRLLVAQALVESLPLVTSDQIIPRYAINTIW